MSTVQDILSQVEKPSRYLGTEINTIRKSSSAIKLSMALAFPDLYEIGTSHFGLQILYNILNRKEHIAAERVFVPARDMEARLRDQGVPLSTLESGRSLATFDIIGFSLLYELNYTNVLNMLDLAGIPLRADQRLASHPLVIAGGPCVCNPEPMAPFFDAMLFGDGEESVIQLADTWLEWKRSDGTDKNALLKQWAQLKGIYIPQFYRADYDDNGFQRLTPMDEAASSVKRSIVADLERTPFPEDPIVPFGRPVHDRLRLEISRGCTRGCRFCQAGIIYRPVRERSCQQLLASAKHSLLSTGYEDLSLLSLSTGDYTCLSALMEQLMVRSKQDRVAVSLPSVRAGTLTPELMGLIQKVRKTGFTIAPEAGSQRLRDVINKNITYDDVAATIEDAFALGWHVIKLYFMIGLPTETDDDVAAIVKMVQKLKTIKGPARRRGQINVSITTFIPKAHTPFQWAPQISIQDSQKKIEFLKQQLKMPGVHVKWQNPVMSLLEGVIARGDRRLSRVVEAAWKKGALFDGWSDQFDFNLWQQAFDACKVDIPFYTSRVRQVEEPLPWAHMKSGATTAFIKQQWRAAQSGQLLSDCRYGDCQQCGVCDFKHIQPQIFDTYPASEAVSEEDFSENEGPFKTFVLTYCKLDQARFFGHLEQANIIARAFRRAQIEIAYSKGFHPMPRISFDNPLPLGMESEAEMFRVKALAETSCRHLLDELNRHLPNGLTITNCQLYSKAKPREISIDRYRVFGPFEDLKISEEKIDLFQRSRQWPHTRYKTKGRVQNVDLKEWVKTLRSDDQQCLYLELLGREGKIIRPSDVLTGVFGLKGEALQSLRVRKLAPYRDHTDG